MWNLIFVLFFLKYTQDFYMYFSINNTFTNTHELLNHSSYILFDRFFLICKCVCMSIVSIRHTYLYVCVFVCLYRYCICIQRWHFGFPKSVAYCGSTSGICQLDLIQICIDNNNEAI